MKALRVLSKDQPAQLVEMNSDELTPGEVHIKIHYSSINYKDALAVTAKGKIIRNFPLNPGIDFSGTVLSCANSDFKPGDSVLVTGCSVGEEWDGGFAEEVKAHANSVIALPKGMSLKEAMFFGTAGFTAALAVHRLLENHQSPAKGPMLVSGATGGVGSFSV
ncbi:MAG TPA: oxidoreductase, partial [Bdellovibrionales bacterium]|nr:oxidoreductase [Bdellovibrionales bacterium]